MDAKENSFSEQLDKKNTSLKVGAYAICCTIL